MKTLWILFQTTFTSLGAVLGWYLGGLDGFLYALITFVIADYITGLLAAISEHRLSSSVGFHGIARKILIFILVGLANLLDIYVLNQAGVLRTATIFFYLSNEGISLIENATRLGLPVPEQIRQALDAITRRSENKPPLTETKENNS
ncbi:MAG: phage holin family protein [Actinomycetaceae bacterium]|nr:phage holin family protein [Actinomycetaceae bacterium]